MGVATCQMDRRPHQDCGDSLDAGDIGSQLGKPMFSNGQKWAEMMCQIPLTKTTYPLLPYAGGAGSDSAFIGPLAGFLNSLPDHL